MHDPSVSSKSSRDSALIAQLRRSMGMLQVAFDAASEAMVIVDSSRRVHWANQASADLLVGGVPIQIVNKILSSILKVHSSDSRSNVLSALLDSGKPLPKIAGESRCQVVFESGEVSPLLMLRWQPVELIQEPFVLVTLRDLSALEKALLQQQRFMTNLTHELRTPLAIVSGNLHRMDRVDGLPVSVISRLVMAQQEMGRIQMLLSDLALIARLEVDPDVLDVGDYSLNHLFNRWFDSIQGWVPFCSIEGLEQWHSLRVQVDERAFLLVMDQLLDNALEYGDSSVPIQIVIEGVDGDSCCAFQVVSLSEEEPVTDSDLETWTTPFTRGKIKRDGQQAESPGLGLALVREIVESCGGRLTICQEVTNALTQTIVRFSLPLGSIEGV